MQFHYKRSIVGGTFDHLHLGHKALLSTAFAKSAYVVVGLATNALFQNKIQAQVIEDFTIRKQALQMFLTNEGYDGRYEIVPITDFYGTSLTDKTIEAIVITESNISNVLTMNEEREKRGFAKLATIIVPYVLSKDGEVISSGQIRNGQIDRTGTHYLSEFLTNAKYHLQEKDREAFRIPLGQVYTSIEDITQLYPKRTIIAVGDVIANALFTTGFQANISIIDGRTRRNEVVESKKLEQTGKLWQTSNQAGTINQEAVTTLKAALDEYSQTSQKQVIRVLGEEDLLAIPAILLSPLKTIVVYGLFGQGIVLVEVSEQNKHDLYHLFRKFQ